MCDSLPLCRSGSEDFWRSRKGGKAREIYSEGMPEVAGAGGRWAAGRPQFQTQAQPSLTDCVFLYSYATD